MPFFAQFQTDSKSISKFIKNVGIRNKGSPKQYHSRLLSFERFAKDYYKNSSKSNDNVDKLIEQLKDKEIDPYDILNDFCLFIQNNYNNSISGATFRDKIITVKTFS